MGWLRLSLVSFLSLLFLTNSYHFSTAQEQETFKQPQIIFKENQKESSIYVLSPELEKNSTQKKYFLIQPEINLPTKN